MKNDIGKIIFILVIFLLTACSKYKHFRIVNDTEFATVSSVWIQDRSGMQGYSSILITNILPGQISAYKNLGNYKNENILINAYLRYYNRGWSFGDLNAHKSLILPEYEKVSLYYHYYYTLTFYFIINSEGRHEIQCKISLDDKSL
ncbi:MAG: hypothetical protein A2096_10160 [Spirochaetes bacterium GWF1_41_5]|nr:MAG: hypothetical protein A2096_10160 [Spirochaetes bacterium GWF1_41_5]